MEEVTQLKDRVAHLTYQKNLHHINSTMAAQEECLCSLSGALKLESPQQCSPPREVPLSLPRPVSAQKTPIKISVSAKNIKKDLAFISRMTKTLTKLENKYSIPVENRKANMCTRKAKTSNIIPKECCAPEPVVTVPEPDPIVDWSNLRFKPALPNPEECPLLSVS